MSTSVPLNFRVSPIPANFKGTPQQFAEAFVERLSAESTNNISFFTTGTVAPSSNLGPFLFNGVEWYVWDTLTASYVPQTISSPALKYIASQTAPDPTIYTFWIELNSSGKAISVKYYYSGNWEDVYADQFALYPTIVAMDTAIANAIAASSFNKAPAKAYNTSSQTFAVTGSLAKVNMAGEWFDPDNLYDTTLSRYTANTTGIYQIDARIQVQNDTATAATMELSFRSAKNGNPFFSDGVINGTAVPSPSGGRWYVACGGLISLNLGDYVEMWLSANDGVLSGNVTISEVQFNISRVA